MPNCQYKNCDRISARHRFCALHDYATNYMRQKVDDHARRKARREERIIRQVWSYAWGTDEKEEKKRPKKPKRAREKREKRDFDYESAFDFFQIASTVTEPEFRTLYKKLVLQYHPDKGGTNEQFRELFQHAEKMRAYFRDK